MIMKPGGHRERHLVTTPATETRCARCRASILIGLAEGLTARVDPAPLDRQQEVTALLGGRTTYTLQAKTLVHRDAGRITDTTLRGPVHREHRCPPKPDTLF